MTLLAAYHVTGCAEVVTFCLQYVPLGSDLPTGSAPLESDWLGQGNRALCLAMHTIPYHSMFGLYKIINFIKIIRDRCYDL